MKVSHTWLQSYFTEILPSAEAIAETLGMRSFECEGYEEDVIEFDILPNRAHDCLSHRGIAREISACMNRRDFVESNAYADTRITEALEEYRTKNYAPATRSISTTIESDACRRHTCRVIENIKVQPSPDWLRTALESIGQRSINNVVDATNYVMYGLGQPNHVFDLDTFSGDTLFIRNAQSGEKVTTLDGAEISLLAEDLVLADSAGALDIAGIKGGTRAELSDTTTSLILSAANFKPQNIRRTARRLPLYTDAAKRFENDLHPLFTEIALEHVTALICMLAGTSDTRVSSTSDVYQIPLSEITTEISRGRIAALLGLDITREQMSSALESVFCTVVWNTDDLCTVTPPPERLDLTIPEEYAEEIGRIIGYEHIPGILYDNQEVVQEVNPLVLATHRLRMALAMRGYNELITYSFTDTGDVHMKSALAEDKSYARASLEKNFLPALETNIYYAPLGNRSDMRIFEVGTVFPDGVEKWYMAIGYDSFMGKKGRSPEVMKQHFDTLLSEIEEETGYALSSHIVPSSDPRILQIDISQVIEKTTGQYGEFPHISYNAFKSFSQYPFISRDIAVWIPVDQKPDTLAEIIKKEAGELLVTEPRCLDTYEKEGRISYAYRFVFQASDRTLSDEEVNPIMERITKACIEKGWEVR